MKTLRILSFIAIGVILAVLLPDKEKENLKIQNQKLKVEIELLKNDKIKNILFGGITVLPKNSDIIRLKGFNGIIAWYESSNYNDLLNNDPAHFQKVGNPLRIDREYVELKIPEGVNAIFKKNLSGHQYSEEIEFTETF